MGSGVCGVIAAREALGLDTRIVAVVSSKAPAFALSFERGMPVSHEATTAIADGMACRTPDAAALAIARYGVERVVQVSDDEVESAMRAIFSDTHNVAEGAGAAALAALIKDKGSMRGRTTAIVLTGGNVDSGVYARVITPGS
jgi:threonine dehydratase